MSASARTDGDTGSTERSDEGVDEDLPEDPDEDLRTDTVTAFDIEEVSALQDAVSPFPANEAP